MAILFMIIFGILFGIFLHSKTKIKIYHGPDSSDVKKTIHVDKKNKKCYAFVPNIYMCPIF